MGEGCVTQDGRAGTGASSDCENRFRALLDGMVEGYVRVTMDGRIVETNAAYRAMLGYDEAELRSLTYLDVTPECWHAMEQRIVEKQILGRHYSEAYEKEYRRKDGTVFPVELRTYLALEDGRPAGMWAIVRNVTERKRTEEALAASEELFRIAFDGSPSGLALMAPDGHPLRVNLALCEMLGYPAARLLVGRWREFTHPDDVEATTRVIEHVRANPGVRGRLEKRFVRSDGSIVWADVTTRAVRDARDEIVHFITSVVDITARKKVEEELRASQELFRTLAEHAPVGIFRSDERGNLVYANPTCERTVGLVAGKLLGRGWLAAIHPDDRERVDRAWREAVAAGRVYDDEARYLGPEGTVIGHSLGAEVRDAAGRPAGYIGVVQDVTHTRALEEQVARNARLSALGTLLAGVAHEINSPLASLRMALEILRQEVERLAAPPRTAEAFAHVEAEADRIARFVRELNVVGRPDATRSRVDLGRVVESALQWLEPEIPREVDVHVERSSSPVVIASDGQIAQLAANLVTRAARSVPAGRRCRVVVRIGAGTKGMARLEVTDDGDDAPPTDLDRMFEPFFGPHANGRGAKLGLSICHAIVTALGGTIEATSQPGKGTTIRAELPLAP